MRTGRGGQPPPRPSTSLRSSFAWTLAGNGVYAAAQWAILSLAAKLGGSEMLGQYALAVAILATGLAQSSETVSDIYYGAMQRRDEMDLIARSMMARGLVSVCAFGVALYVLRDLVWELAAVAGGGRGGRSPGLVVRLRSAAGRHRGVSGAFGPASRNGDLAHGDASGRDTPACLVEHEPSSLCHRTLSRGE